MQGINNPSNYVKSVLIDEQVSTSNGLRTILSIDRLNGNGPEQLIDTRVWDKTLTIKDNDGNITTSYFLNNNDNIFIQLPSAITNSADYLTNLSEGKRLLQSDTNFIEQYKIVTDNILTQESASSVSLDSDASIYKFVFTLEDGEEELTGTELLKYNLISDAYDNLSKLYILYNNNYYPITILRRQNTQFLFTFSESVIDDIINNNSSDFYSTIVKKVTLRRPIETKIIIEDNDALSLHRQSVPQLEESSLPRIGSYSIAWGEDVDENNQCMIASGKYSMAFGIRAKAFSDNSLAYGFETIAGTQDTEITVFSNGNTECGGIFSLALGKGTITNHDYQITLGKYNYPNSSASLIIGGGTDNINRKNSLIFQEAEHRIYLMSPSGESGDITTTNGHSFGTGLWLCDNSTEGILVGNSNNIYNSIGNTKRMAAFRSCIDRVGDIINIDNTEYKKGQSISASIIAYSPTNKYYWNGNSGGLQYGEVRLIAQTNALIDDNGDKLIERPSTAYTFAPYGGSNGVSRPTLGSVEYPWPNIHVENYRRFITSNGAIWSYTGGRVWHPNQPNSNTINGITYDMSNQIISSICGIDTEYNYSTNSFKFLFIATGFNKNQVYSLNGKTYPKNINTFNPITTSTAESICKEYNKQNRNTLCDGNYQFYVNHTGELYSKEITTPQLNIINSSQRKTQLVNNVIKVADHYYMNGNTYTAIHESGDTYYYLIDQVNLNAISSDAQEVAYGFTGMAYDQRSNGGIYSNIAEITAMASKWYDAGQTCIRFKLTSSNEAITPVLLQFQPFGGFDNATNYTYFLALKIQGAVEHRVLGLSGLLTKVSNISNDIWLIRKLESSELEFGWYSTKDFPSNFSENAAYKAQSVISSNQTFSPNDIVDLFSNVNY